ncbi:FAD-binding oxidoreductase [Microbacterium schleiferi]|uniref:FAD-binding oxidoreductase n=1 Tax=Microbacterium schleiferi TaxID=69362 RepID=A0A7S8RIR5_9MICO|nr:FAD-binding oxidoreductase [Microbacterium schleiferi]QPE05657.1 FAD-binding oxidoreductase [Microbacterium schleiferi]
MTLTSPDPTVSDPLAAAEYLRAALGSRVVLPGEEEYDTVRRPWNLAIDQRPFAVARPTSAEDVVDIVRAAVATGLRVAPQSTGHAAGALADTDLSQTILLWMGGLRGVTVNAENRTARVLGGSHWNDVLAEAAPLGLTALHGSAGDVSVVGYTLSGGLSFYARAHGLAVGSVRSVTMVTADGRLVTASATENAELFWAVRGGSGAFGVIVSLEIDLLPYADVFAGMLLWDLPHAARVSHAWREWTMTAPESATTALRILHFPPDPALPPFLRGRSVVVIDGAILESDADAAALLQPLRNLAPEIDTFRRIPAAELIAVHMDPPVPTPSATAHAMLAELTPEAVNAFVSTASAPSPMMAELRHLGGAAARPSGGGAITSLDGEYLLAAIGMIPEPQMADLARALTRGLVEAMSSWRASSLALTFVDGGVENAAGFGDSAPQLSALKRQFDPADLFAAANPVPRAS